MPAQSRTSVRTGPQHNSCRTYTGGVHPRGASQQTPAAQPCDVLGASNSTRCDLSSKQEPLYSLPFLVSLQVGRTKMSKLPFSVFFWLRVSKTDDGDLQHHTAVRVSAAACAGSCHCLNCVHLITLPVAELGNKSRLLQQAGKEQRVSTVCTSWQASYCSPAKAHGWLLGSPWGCPVSTAHAAAACGGVRFSRPH